MKSPQKYKISELINELNDMLKQYGDLSVTICEENDTNYAGSQDITIVKNKSEYEHINESITIYGYKDSF